MKFGNAIKMLFVSLVLGAGSSSAFAQNTHPDAELRGVKIVFDTPEGDDKDTDTQITVRLYTKENNEFKRIIANKDNFAGDTTFEDPPGGSKHEYELDIQGAVKRSQVDGLRVVIEIQPEGRDTWIFNYKVQLNFSDETVLEKGADGIKLKQSSRKHEKTY